MEKIYELIAKTPMNEMDIHFWIAIRSMAQEKREKATDVATLGQATDLVAKCDHIIGQSNY